MTLQLTGGTGKEKRRDLDFYPTPSDVTWALLQFLKLPTGLAVLEPACGTGEMATVLSAYGFQVTSTDLNHTGFGTGGVDFLTAELAPNSYGAVITNPPFCTSQQFIERALTAAPCVAMLLKSQYWHAKKRSTLFESHPPAYVLPLSWRPDFMNGSRGGAPTMEVAWSVWLRGETDTRYRVLSKPENRHYDIC